MRGSALFLAVALVCQPLSAQAAVIGGPMLRDGIEIVPIVLNDVEVDRLTHKGSDPIWLGADVHAANGDRYGFGEHGFIIRHLANQTAPVGKLKCLAGRT